MLTITEAKAIALVHIARIVDDDVDPVIRDNLSIAKPYGWVFFYNSREYVETGNRMAAVGGNGPVVVQHDGTVHMLTSAKAPEDSLAEFESARGLPGGE